METIYKSTYGEIIHGDNLEVMKTIEDSSIDSCISDFPYAIDFMNKSWDSNNNFQEWCFNRAIELMRICKPGAYVAIFGHPKANHRMKYAFEDAGFKIVEEIDWIYLSGMPKNQDISKLFEKAEIYELAEKWDGWKTAGVKPAHEPITIFQKPLECTYIHNIEKYNCGAMNIDACRVEFKSQEDIDVINAKVSKNPTSNYSDREDKVYGSFAEDRAVPANPEGRFPPNCMFDEYMATELDTQTGISKSSGGSGEASRKNRCRYIYGAFNDKINSDYISESLGGYGDIGGGSRMFPVFKYTAKVSPSERKLSNGDRNPHVTLKPIELIKWLIKLLTPKSGTTIDITAGSCTHAVACEQLKAEGYNLKYINIELMNTKSDPYCDVGKQRVESEVEIQKNTFRPRKLF